MNYSLLRRTTVARQATLEKELRAAKATVTSAEKELKSLGEILGALKGVDGAAMPRGTSKVKGKRRKGGKWRPGHPGRPPKWYSEKMKGKGKTKASKATKPARKAKRKKRTASPKMLAALEKARAAMAAKRAATASAPASS